MKKKIISITVFILIALAGFAKANTKKRVYQLEKEVVSLSKSERESWDTIEKMNKQLAKLEQQVSQKLAKKRKKRNLAQMIENEDDYEDEDSSDDDLD